MGMNRATLDGLQKAAAGFSTPSHGRYLAEAARCAHDTGDPLAALRLLHAMWNTSYAPRGLPKEALNDVGGWLERRLWQEPEVATEKLELELGWLRRLARYSQAMLQLSKKGPAPGPDRGAATDPPLRFGKLIDKIAERRAREAKLTPLRSPRSAAAPAATAAPPPDRLPAVFEADFINFAEARDARRAMRERIKKKKPPKDTLLRLQPVDPRLRPLAAGLVCSTQNTDGFEALFLAIDANAGAPRSFHVTEVAARDDTLFAGKILLVPDGSAGGSG